MNFESPNIDHDPSLVSNITEGYSVIGVLSPFFCYGVASSYESSPMDNPPSVTSL